MGKLEEKGRKRRKKRDTQALILQTIAMVGVLSVGFVAPNVLMAAEKLGLIPNPRDKEIFKSSLFRLKKKGLVILKGGKYSLTSKGEKFLRKIEIANYQIRKPKKWDGQWRVVIFDIPEKLKRHREQIRVILISAGFLRLQDSVWVYPYDCEDIVTLIKTDLGVEKYMLYLIVDQIENDKHLKREFDLE